MDPVTISTIAGLTKNVIQRIWPNKDDQIKAEQASELLSAELAKAQIETNKTEGAHKNIFVAGWRPFIGWICGLALMNNYIIMPYVVAFGGKPVELNISELLSLLFGMLGIAGYRTFEKIKGKA